MTPQIWIPHQVSYDWWSEVSPGKGVAVLARVNDGSSFEQATAQLDSLADLHRDRFFDGASFQYEFVPLIRGITEEVRSGLLVLFGAVGFVLLIAIANASTLVLGRAQSRANEFAVRYALGGSSWRVLKELIAESALPALVGAALGRTFLVATPADAERSRAAGQRREIGINDCKSLCPNDR